MLLEYNTALISSFHFRPILNTKDLNLSAILNMQLLESNKALISSFHFGLTLIIKDLNLSVFGSSPEAQN